MTLVVDATVVVPGLLGPAGLTALGDPNLVAPPLMWSEASSVLHRAVLGGTLPRDEAVDALDRLEGEVVRMRNPRRLRHEAWRFADRLGWGRTHDAEYVALASLMGCRLVTLDGRLRRGTDRLGFVVLPHEL